MSTQDELEIQAPQKVYLFPTPTSAGLSAVNGRQSFHQRDSLVFQYWPQSLQDDYQPEYAEHSIPGGSHPLYQWVGGRGRTITFEAIFTAELNQTRQSGLNGGLRAAAASIATSLVPSSPFTVNVAGALAKIRSWMLPQYSEAGRLGETNPPKILTLVFPNTRLAGDGDLIQVILRSAPVTIESWFPNGEPRIASVALTFNEVVQSPAGGGQDNAVRVRFIGRSAFESEGTKYKFRGVADRPFVGGN